MIYKLLLALLPLALLAASGGVAQEDAAANSEVSASPLDFADGLFQRGFFDDAVTEYEGYLAKHPEGSHAAMAWYRLGESAYAARQYDKALNAFDQALNRSLTEETRRLAALSRAEVLFHVGKHAESRAALEAMAPDGLPPELRGRVLYYLGKAHAALNQLDAAVAVFGRFLEQLPEDRLAPFARYELAFALLSRLDLEKAALEFSNVATSEAPAELRQESRFRAAEIYDKMGWYSAAIGAYEQLKKDFPDSEYAERADYGYAWALYHGEDPEGALEAAGNFLRAKPESPHAPGLKYLQGNALQQLKRYDEAITAFTGVREQHGESPFAVRAQYKSAWLHYLKGETAAAKNEVLAFLNVQQESPLLSDAHFLLGSIHVAEGKVEDALREYQLVAEQYPESAFAPEALFKAAECLAQLGLSGEAARQFGVFVERYVSHPLVPQALLRAGDTQFRAQDFVAAVTQYGEVLKREVDPAVEHDALYRLALSYHNMNSFQESAERFGVLLEKHPDSPYAPEARFRMAEFALKEAGDPERAAPLYQAVLDAAPDGEFAGRALRGLGLARFEQQEFDLASALFLRLTQEYPDVPLNEDVYIWTAQYFFDQEQWEQAVTAFENLLKAVPDYPYPERVQLVMAEARERAGNPEEALKGYQAVVNAAPETSTAAEARFRMAKLHEAQDHTGEAIALYESAAESNHGDTAARALFRLGELYEAQGEHDRAARSFMQVVILFLHEELSPQALWRAGQNYEQSGNAAQARKAFEEVVSDYPDSEYAAQAAASLAAPAAGT